jgi:hypothetical protein
MRRRWLVRILIALLAAPAIGFFAIAALLMFSLSP